jgi:hypothetical protein
MLMPMPRSHSCVPTAYTWYLRGGSSADSSGGGNCDGGGGGSLGAGRAESGGFRPRVPYLRPQRGPAPHRSMHVPRGREDAECATAQPGRVDQVRSVVLKARCGREIAERREVAGSVRRVSRCLAVPVLHFLSSGSPKRGVGHGARLRSVLRAVSAASSPDRLPSSAASSSIVPRASRRVAISPAKAHCTHVRRHVTRPPSYPKWGMPDEAEVYRYATPLVGPSPPSKVSGSGSTKKRTHRGS